jgi:ubiquitin related modifier 1
MASTIPIKLEFTYVPSHSHVESSYSVTNPLHSGGLELLFSNQRSHKIALPSTDPATNEPVNVGFLIDWLCKNLMKDPRQDMFVLEGTV